MAEDKAKDKKSDEELAAEAPLPPGHPRAGYVAPDLSEHVGTGTIPEAEKEWHEARNEAREEGVEQVEKAEKEASKEEREERERQAEISKERAAYLEKEKVGPTAGQLPGDPGYDPEKAQKKSASSSSSSSK